ncbi:MAG: hypothetical protein AMK73_07660 [Planctomycetes bacterium SM23_32]|nr:MAG: hypothetical protein AMK73_07660 [Planctomycetes bacterium SM23_32]
MIAECKRRMLPNGLRLLGVENRALHAFVCSVYVRVGPRFESSEQIGLSHFLEHMIMQGSEKFPDSNTIMRGVEDLGGVVDASTYAEYINVVFGVHRKHWRRVMDIAADVLLRPLFAEAEIEQEKQIVAQEIMQHRDRQGRNISTAELAHSIMFRGRVCEAGTRGDPDLLARFDRAAVQGHYRRYFRPENTVVCLAGGLDFDEVVGEVEERFGQMPSDGEEVGRPLAAVANRTGRSRAFYRQTEALPVAEVLLCHVAPGLGDRRHDAVRAASHLLGGGLSSRLFARVREELGLVYDIHSHLQSYSDTAAMEVFLTVGVENMPAAFEAALHVLRQTRADGFAADELARYKEAASCGMEMLCDQASPLADWFGRQELLLEPQHVRTPEEHVQRQQALTLGDLHAAMEEMASEAGVTLVAVGPYEERELTAMRGLLAAEEADAPGVNSERRDRAQEEEG